MRRDYRIWCAFDTETCNVGRRAYPILYIFNDLHQVDIATYEVDDPCEEVTFLRRSCEAVAYIEQVIEDGIESGYVPIVCVYNMMFDLQTILYELAQTYECVVNAQSSTNVYTLDLMLDGKKVLRFWDTYHLEMGGLKAMGRTCGVDKLMGDWDYDLVRTPETPLTEQELGYAKRDVQVIPAYLAYLLRANPWMRTDMLGCRVLTKTSIVRQMARAEIGPLDVDVRGRKLKLIKAFEELCRRELPHDFDSYALRLACFRGGLVFTAARFAGVPVQNVVSLDVTSMHHAYLNGRRVPVEFRPIECEALDVCVTDIARHSVADVLRHYHYPFGRWLHVQVRARGVRLRRGSAFAAWGIATLAQAKFARRVPRLDVGDENVRAIEAENAVRCAGYGDVAIGATFALGKLYEAQEVIVHMTEIELWCFMQVYEYESLEAIGGEIATRSILPPDYVSLQSNILFSRKSDAKALTAGYEECVPYAGEIGASIPTEIAQATREGALSKQFLGSWYQSTVKGSFNGIYGTQAQNVYKPDYMVDEDAELHIDQATKPTPENFSDKQPKHPMVLYTYGMRIVAGSRMELVIAITLLYERFGDAIAVTGGDTDSLKVMLTQVVTPDDLIQALAPLHEAATRALDVCMSRARSTFPDKASTLAHVGCFEIEPATKAGKVTYDWHMEGWNKARISIVDNHAHITCAGLSRPEGAYTLEDWCDGMLRRGMDPRDVMRAALGYNTNVTNDVCHALEHHKPLFRDRYEGDVTDYLGNSTHINEYEAVALYPAGRRLGDTSKGVNADSVAYLESVYGRDVDTSEKEIGVACNVCLLIALVLMDKPHRSVVRMCLRDFYVPTLRRV